MNNAICILCSILSTLFLLIFPVYASASLNGPAKMASIPIPFLEQPGDDPAAIRIKIEEGTLSVNENGKLEVLTAQYQGTAVHDSGVITCEMGTIDASGGSSVSIVMQISESINALSISTSVSAAQTDTNEANNSLITLLSTIDDDDDNGLCFITTSGR